MSDNAPGKSRNNGAKAKAPRAAPPRATSAGMKRYIAGQLKAMYDEVVAEPVPERLVRLLDQLDKPDT